MNKSSPNPSSGRDNYRRSLQDTSQTKNVYFFKDGDSQSNAVKLAIHPKKYRSFDYLLNELTRKIPDLTYGVRSIYTPRGNDNISSLDELANCGHYICSTHTNYARGCDFSKVQRYKPWHNARPSSGRREYNNMLGRRSDEPFLLPKRHQIEPKGVRVYKPLSRPKKITVLRNGYPAEKHIVLLNRRTAQTFEQVMTDLSDMFHMAIRKVYTIDGRRIHSLQQVLSGPDVLVAASTEPFKPMGIGFLFTPCPPQSKQLPLSTGSSEDTIYTYRSKRDLFLKTKGKWHIKLTTNELPTAGTCAQVFINVYGSKGSSGPIPLGFADGEHFQCGNIDEFEISVGNIGEIYKIRISHDNTSDFPGWLCDEVRMRDVDTEELLVFPCKQWLSREEEDGAICRELPVSRKGRQPLPVLTYLVAVTTGDKWNAGINANVYITLYGENGDTGVRQLVKDNQEQLFHQDQTDVFNLEAVMLGTLQRVAIGHEGTGPGNGWFLEKILVTESLSQSKFLFFCGRWLDEGEDDGKIVRELRLHDQKAAETTYKECWESEKWKLADRNEVMFFSKLTSKALRIQSDASVDALGEEENPEGIFIILTKKGVWSFGSTVNPKFHLTIDSGRMWGQGKGGASSDFYIHSQKDRTVMLESAKYPLNFITVTPSGKAGDVRGHHANASRQFYVYCKGMFRNNGVVMFQTSTSQTLSVNDGGNVFATGKRNQDAHFRVHKVPKGKMFESLVKPGQYLRLRSGKVDCIGKPDQFSQFIVEKHKDKSYVCLQSVFQHGIYVGITPEGNIQPTVYTGTKNIWFYPEVIEFGDSVDKTVPRNQWTASPEVEDRLLLEDAELTLDGENELIERKETPNSPFKEGDWMVHVTTLESVTDADVVLVVYGEKGNSGSVILGRAGKQGLFQKGETNKFKINLLEVGAIYKIRLELSPTNNNKNPSWKVEEVVMLNLNAKDEMLVFLCKQWLSWQHVDRDLMLEMPAVRPGQKVLPIVTYCVNVYTGNEPGSETDADVYLTLFGDRGDSGRRHLWQSENSKMFQGGQVDTFEIKAVSLEKLVRCVIGHDAVGAGQGWFLNYLTVVEQGANQEYVFPCYKWLDSGMEDRKIERVLALKEIRPLNDETSKPEEIRPLNDETSKPEDGDWSVLVTTGSGVEMGTINTVLLYIYGSNRCAGPVVLCEGEDEPFQPGKTSSCKISVADDLGDVYKVRIGHDDQNPASGWFLQELKMVDMVTGKELQFKVNRWMSSNHDDKDVWRELSVQKEGQFPLPVIVYQVEIYTGEQQDFPLKADAYIQLIGTRGDTGKRKIAHSKNSIEPFCSGQMDMFEIEAVSLEEIKKVVIGHSGPGKCWFLEKVIVKGADGPIDKYYFPWDGWVDESQENCVSEAVIEAQSPPSFSDGDWTVWVTTGSEGTTNTVQLHVYGNNGSSGPIVLNKDQENLFQPRTTKSCKINIKRSLEELYKIRIGHDNRNTKSEWFLEKLKMKNMTSGEELKFQVHRWLSSKREDRDVWRELPIKQHNQQLLPVVVYMVEVYTGNIMTAAPEADMFIQLFGTRGDSGQRAITHSSSSEKPFLPGQRDVFEIEAVCLDEIKQILIGHNNSTEGSGWYLDNVVIKETGNPSKMLYFPCDRWLDSGQNDRKIEILIEAQDPPAESKGEYSVFVTTCSDSFPTKKRPKAYLVVYGEKDASGEKELLPTDEKTVPFQPGTTDEFQLTVGDLGNIFKIRISREDTDTWEGWHVEEIKMVDKATEQELVFLCNRWLARNKDDFDLAREISVMKDQKPVLPVFHYEISVYTGNVWAAGTDAAIHLTIHGQKGDTGCRRLYHSKNNQWKFQRGQMDVFEYEAVSLGEPTYIAVGHDSQGHGAGWFLDKIVVTEKDGDHPNLKYIFPCGHWLDDHEEDGKTERMIRLVNTEESNKRDDAEKTNTKNKSKKKDKEKKLAPVLKNVMPMLCLYDYSLASPLGELKVIVKTSDIPNAGTCAQVFLTVFGLRSQSERLPLGSAGPNSQDFAEGKQSEFLVNIGVIGDITKIHLEHDGTGHSPSWHIDYIKLVPADDADGKELIFYFNCWLETTDHQLIREAAAQLPDLLLPTFRYIIVIETGKGQNSETFGDVFLNLIGQHGNTGLWPLADSLNNTMALKRNQLDVFIIEAVSVGHLQRVELCLKGKKDESWYPEQVRVRESHAALLEYVFNCQRWLELDSDHIQDTKEFFLTHKCQATSLPEGVKWKHKSLGQSKGSWVVWVYTGEDSGGGGASEDVFLVIYGTKGWTNPKNLNKTRGLKPGAICQLEVFTGDIGDIFKIHVYFGDKTASWFFRKLKLKDKDTGQEFHFDYNNWMNVSEENPSGLVELPAIRPNVSPLEENEYVVSVKTGTQQAADTKAKVYCKLIGEWGDSGERLLVQRKDGSISFQKGQVDEFCLSVLELGLIRKVILGHREIGRGRGWFCEQVTVQKAFSDSMRVFPSHRWFDTGCEDRMLERELMSGGEVAVGRQAQIYHSAGTWLCQIVTASQDKLSDTVDMQQVNWPSLLIVTVVGDKGSSEVLDFRDGNREMFLPGRTAEFPNLEIGDLGEIQKIRLFSGIDQNSHGNIWTVDEVALQHSSSEQMLKFDFSCWLGKLSNGVKELPVLKAGKVMAPRNVAGNSGTVSKVHLTLRGTNGDSGCRLLGRESERFTKFEVGQVDEFLIEAVDLGDVDQLTLTKGAGSPWYIDKVLVKPGQFTPTAQVFILDRWIGSVKTQNIEVEETTAVTKYLPNQVVSPVDDGGDLETSRGNWTVHTLTGNSVGAIRDVQLVFCGTAKESQPLLLKSDEKNLFQKDKRNLFKLLLAEDVGELYKIRIGYSDVKTTKKWLLLLISFEDDDTRDTFSYELNEWVTVDEKTDGWTEFPVTWPALPVPKCVKYQVAVHTGKVHKPGSNVYLEIKGTKGCTGRRLLKYSKTNKKMFNENQVDVFEVQAVSLEQLTTVIIGHNKHGERCGWFLEKVVIKENPETTKEYAFECNRWLDEGEDDKKLERELQLAASVSIGDDVDWRVTTVTSSEDNSGTDANVTMTVYGDRGNSGQLTLGQPNSGYFETGHRDQFDIKFDSEEVGKIQKIRLEHDNSGMAPGWRVEKLILQNLLNKEELEFSINKWLSFDDKYGDIAVEVPATRSEEVPSPVYKYMIQTVTSSDFGAGTDANVYIKLVGNLADSGKRYLKNSLENGNKFERDKTDTFMVEAVDLGQLSTVVIGHDGSGPGSGWKLDKVVVKQTQTATKKYIFLCDRWLDNSQDDDKTERELTLAEIQEESS